MVEEASRRTPLGGCRESGIAVAVSVAVFVAVVVAVAVAVAMILAAATAVADGGGRCLGLGRGFGRGFGHDCARRTWLGDVPATVAAVAVVLTISAVASVAAMGVTIPGLGCVCDRCRWSVLGHIGVNVRVVASAVLAVVLKVGRVRCFGCGCGFARVVTAIIVAIPGIGRVRWRACPPVHGRGRGRGRGRRPG